MRDKAVSIASVYPRHVVKAEKKERSKTEVQDIISSRTSALSAVHH
ncbi:DUF2200 family protein [Sphingobium phenoxybenzoativorans]